MGEAPRAHTTRRHWLVMLTAKEYWIFTVKNIIDQFSETGYNC